MKPLSQDNTRTQKTNVLRKTQEFKVTSKIHTNNNKEYLLKTILETNYGHLMEVKNPKNKKC